MALEALRNNNYGSWSACLRDYLLTHNLWDVVETTTEVPKPEDDVVEFEAWREKNDAALDAILTSCGIDVPSQIKGISSAKTVWYTLAKMYGQLPQGVNSEIEQGNSSNNPGAQMYGKLPHEVLNPEIEQENSLNSPGRENVGSHNYAKYSALVKAVQRGDLKAVQDFLKDYPEATSAKVTWRNETALHIAVFAEKIKIIEELVKVMSPEDLAIRDADGYTALARAAASEDCWMAECMIRKNQALVSIPEHKGGKIPVVLATNLGNKEVARYLYYHTTLQDFWLEKGDNGASLLSDAIYGENFDIALDLIERCPWLARTLNRNKRLPLYALACIPKAFLSGNRLVFWEKWIYKYGIHIQLGGATKYIRLNIQNDQDIRGIGSAHALRFQLASHLLKFFGFKQLYDMKLRHVQSHQLLSRICEKISTLNREESVAVFDALFRAAKDGIFEIVFEMVRKNPSVVQIVDSDGRTIFMIAVLNRQTEIFSLIYGLKRKKAALAGADNVSGNTILHMAGMLTDSTPINHIPGAALQMQRELQWFKEVESMVPPAVKNMLNKDKLTPKQLFTLRHEELRKKGEVWMQSTSTSCTVVGALIITIMFAVAFAVPGGNNQDTGLPLFKAEKLFILFMIFDSLSLFSSSASVLIFLGILTSPYAEEDFIESLPKKLIIGLSTLFFSIATMMTTFSFALLMMLRGRFRVVIPIICLASVPVTLFVVLQFPLLVGMLKSTYGQGVFNRKMKSCL